MSGFNILVTGVSGGGDLLEQLFEEKIVEESQVSVILRSNAVATKISNKYKKIKILVSEFNETEKIVEFINQNEIRLVVHTANSFDARLAFPFLEALHRYRKQTRKEVYFIHTAGTSMLSDYGGWPVTGATKDTDKLYTISKETKAFYSLRYATTVIQDRAEKLGVSTYVVVPPTIVGKGRGLGNKISIQFPQAIKQSIKFGTLKVYQSDNQWPIVHIEDNSRVFSSLISRIVHGNAPELYDKDEAYYFISTGQYKWTEFFDRLANILYKRKIIESPYPENVETVDEAAEFWGFYVGLFRVGQTSNSVLEAVKAKKILGWKPKYSVQELLDNLESEVDLVIAETNKE